MSGQAAVKTQTTARPAITPVAGGVLQRQCACGQHTNAGGECEECKKKRVGTLHRAAIGPPPVPDVPPIVHEVLRSPGQPLDAETRAFMEPRFGRDFSGVRVHTDAQAAESARAVNALAYTIGQNVVFGAGQYAPVTTSGRRLVAHELAHTVQQGVGAARSRGRLNISAAHDPAEAAADRAADAALNTRAMPALAPAGLAINRQEGGPGSSAAQIEATADANVKIVRLGARRFRVTRELRRRERVSRVPSPTATPGIDRDNIWVEITWCEGQTQGHVRAQADIPNQVLETLIRTFTSGGDIDAALRQASVTPRVSANVSIGRWRITAEGRVTIDTAGQARSGGGGITLETPGDVDIFAEYERSRDPSTGREEDVVTGGIRITPGRSRRAPRCTQRREVIVPAYSCEEERDRPPLVREGTRPEPRTQERSRFIYFNYANATIEPRQSAAAQRDLPADLREGFRVARVRGFTSPEGPVEQVPGQRFEGNRALSEERARAAREEVERICRRERIPGGCFGENVTEAGEIELYPLRDPETGAEVEGDPQAEFAAQEFLRQEQEVPRRTPDVTRRLRGARTPRQRANIVYPMLRRAEIVLTRTQIVDVPFREVTPQLPERTSLASCPPEVVQAAFPDATRQQGAGGRP